MLFECHQLGLWLNVIGSALIGISIPFGLSARFGGAVAFKPTVWKFVYVAGWITLAVGFGVQLKLVQALGICN